MSTDTVRDKRFLHDQDVPQNMKSLQRELMSNLERKSHLLLSDLSRRNSYDTVTASNSMGNSDYPLSDDTFTNRAHHSPRDGAGSRHLNHLSLSHSQDTSSADSQSLVARDLQQIYVAFFRETLRSRTKACYVIMQALTLFSLFLMLNFKFNKHPTTWLHLTLKQGTGSVHQDAICPVA